MKQYRLQLKKIVPKMGFELGFLGRQVAGVPIGHPCLLNLAICLTSTLDKGSYIRFKVNLVLQRKKEKVNESNASLQKKFI